MRQRSHLEHRSAALDGGDAAFERREAAGNFVGDIELRRRKGVGIAVGANRPVGADAHRLFEGTVENIGHGNMFRAAQARRDHGETADGAGAGDEHRLAEKRWPAVHRVQCHCQRLGKRELTE